MNEGGGRGGIGGREGRGGRVHAARGMPRSGRGGIGRGGIGRGSLNVELRNFDALTIDSTITFEEVGISPFETESSAAPEREDSLASVSRQENFPPPLSSGSSMSGRLVDTSFTAGDTEDLAPNTASISRLNSVREITPCRNQSEISVEFELPDHNFPAGLSSNFTDSAEVQLSTIVHIVPSEEVRRCNVANMIYRLSKCFDIDAEMSSELAGRFLRAPFSYQEPTQCGGEVKGTKILIDIKDRLKIPVSTLGFATTQLREMNPDVDSAEAKNATVIVENGGDSNSSPLGAHKFLNPQEPFLRTKYAYSKPCTILCEGKKLGKKLTFNFQYHKPGCEKSADKQAAAGSSNDDECDVCSSTPRDRKFVEVLGKKAKRMFANGRVIKTNKKCKICLECWADNGVCFSKLRKVGWMQLTGSECKDLQTTALWYGARGFEARNRVSTLNSFHLGRELTEKDASYAADIEYAVQIVLMTMHSLHISGKSSSRSSKCEKIDPFSLSWSFMETLKNIICESFNVSAEVLKDHIFELTHTCKWFEKKKIKATCDACEDKKTTSQMIAWLGNALEKNSQWHSDIVPQFPCMCSGGEDMKPVTQCDNCLPLFYSFFSTTHKHREMGVCPVKCHCMACWACATLDQRLSSTINTNDEMRTGLLQGPLRCGLKSLERAVRNPHDAGKYTSSQIFPSIALRVLTFPKSPYSELMGFGNKPNFARVLIQNLELVSCGFKGQVWMGKCKCDAGFDTICPICHPFYFQESQAGTSDTSVDSSSLQVCDILSNDIMIFFVGYTEYEIKHTKPSTVTMLEASSHAGMFAHFMMWISERYSIWKATALKFTKNQQPDLYEKFKSDIESLFSGSSDVATYYSNNRSSNKSLRVIQLHFDIAVRAAIPSLLSYLCNVWIHAHREFQDCKIEFQIAHGGHDINSILNDIDHAKKFFANEVDVKKFIWDVVRCPNKKSLWSNLQLTEL